VRRVRASPNPKVGEDGEDRDCGEIEGTWGQAETKEVGVFFPQNRGLGGGGGTKKGHNGEGGGVWGGPGFPHSSDLKGRAHSGAMSKKTQRP